MQGWTGKVFFPGAGQDQKSTGSVTTGTVGGSVKNFNSLFFLTKIFKFSSLALLVAV